MATSPKKQIFAPLRLCARPITVARQDVEMQREREDVKRLTTPPQKNIFAPLREIVHCSRGERGEAGGHRLRFGQMMSHERDHFFLNDFADVDVSEVVIGIEPHFLGRRSRRVM